MNSPAPQLRSRVPRIAGAAVERARLTVVPRTRAVPAARVPFVVLVSAVMLGGVVGLLMFNTSMQQSSFAITTLEERAGNLAAREQQLAAELEELRDPQVLAAEARERGMRTPPSTAFLHLGTGEVTGEAQPAAGLDRERIHPRPAPLPRPLNPVPVVVEAAVPGEAPPEGVLPEDTGAASEAAGEERGTTGARDESRRDQRSQQSRDRDAGQTRDRTPNRR